MEHIDGLPLKNKPIYCIDCGARFIFTADEQRYYLSKSLSEPKRCPECRRRRRATLVPDKGVRR